MLIAQVVFLLGRGLTQSHRCQWPAYTHIRYCWRG